jgi:signal transduction histidine kinase
VAPLGCAAWDGARAQVIINLLTNALKFTPAGGRVTIATRAKGTRAVVPVMEPGWRARSGSGHHRSPLVST